MLATREIIGGTPELLIDGEAIGRSFARVGYPGWMAADKLDQYREAGFDLFMTNLFEPNVYCWDGLDGYDYQTYDHHVRQLIDAMPEIRLILFTGGRQGAPYLWCKQHQEELILLHNGVRLRAGSFGSERWLRDSTRAITRFVDHYENSPYADHIAGYQPVLFDNEWRLALDRGGYGDFSEPMQRSFRDWLRTHYHGDEKLLRHCWKSNTVTFSNAAIPSVEDRESCKAGGMFGYTEARGMNIADFYRCHNERVAAFVKAQCRAIKEACNRRKLVCLMQAYAYCAPSCWTHPQQIIHLAGQTILECQDVDCVHSPYHYYNRSIGGAHYSQHAVSSVKLNGKVMLAQIDTKTHVHPPPNTNAATPWESEQILKRDVAHAISHNIYHYWYEMAVPTFRGQNGAAEWRENTYEPAPIRSLIARMRNLARDIAAERPEPAAEIALLTSQRSDFYRQMEPAFGNLYVEALRQYLMPYVSAPFDDYLLEDIGKIGRTYKIYLVPNALFVPEELRQQLRTKFIADAATVVWFYAPGYVHPTGCDLRGVGELSGMTMEVDRSPADYLQTVITEPNHPYARGLKVREFGSDIDPHWFQSRQEWASWFSLSRNDHKLAPRFHVRDGDAESIGVWRGSSLVSLAAKSSGGFTSVFVGSPMPPVALLQNIFAHAGVHRYSDHDDLVYANRRFVAVCARGGDGTRTIRFPTRCTVRNPCTGERLGEDVTEIIRPMKDLETLLLRLS